MAASDERPPVSRREFLAASLVAASASSLPGCAPRPLVVRGACHHDCPDTCAWLVTVANGQGRPLRGRPRRTP